MAEIIKDGTGKGNTAKVDNNNQLHTFSVTESEQRQASQIGNEYNINTGTIAYTGTGDSSMIYFKNDEDTDFVVTAVAVGLGTRSATVTDSANVTIIRNPTGGDLISDATAVSINSNTNFGSSNALSSTTLIYKGKDGGTIRLYASLNIELPKGSSVAVKIDLNTSGGANAYCALIGYLKSTNNS
jgi:hypothetical protein